MYKRLSDTDPDFEPPKTTSTSLRGVHVVILVILATVFVIGIYVMTNSRSIKSNQMFDSDDYTTQTLSTVLSTGFSTELSEVVTKPTPKSPKFVIRKNRIPDRVVFDDKYMKITDCSDSNDFFVQYFTFDKMPLNLEANTTINSRIIMKEGFHWSTDLEIEMEKWFFGLDFLSLKLPCISNFFGSCRFNFCDMLRLHWDEQFCTYIHNRYEMSCQCPDVLGPGVFILDDWHYKPVLHRIMKWFSWFAEGWYNLKIKLYSKHNSTKPFMCYNAHFKLISEGDEKD